MAHSTGPIDVVTADGRYVGILATEATALPDAFGPRLEWLPSSNSTNSMSRGSSCEGFPGTRIIPSGCPFLAVLDVVERRLAIRDRTPANWRSIGGQPPLAERVPAIRPLDSPVFQSSGFGEHSQTVGRAAVRGTRSLQCFLDFLSGPPMTIAEVVQDRVVRGPAQVANPLT